MTPLEIKTILDGILDIFFVIILLFQIFYIFSVLPTILIRKPSVKEGRKVREKISIIIPLFNSEKTIGRCLESILQNNLSLVDSLIIVLDHCSDNSGNKANPYSERFKKLGVEFLLSELPENITGKVNAIKQGISFINVKNILLIDADVILKKEAISQLLYFHLNHHNSFSSCLIYPYQKSKNNFISDIICQDRLYRQNIIQTVKNKYGVANFPGSVGLVNIEEYKKFLFSGFLEDLTASFRILGDKEKIAIMPSVLAYEYERESLKGLFLQRIRWSIGNIENIPLLIKTIMAENKVFKKFLIASYPFMWYFQHYFIVLGLILTIFTPFKIVWLFPLFLYSLQVMISNILAKKSYHSTVLGIIGHCLLFPVIITTALAGGILLIIKNKKVYFKDALLFKRI